MAEAKQWSNVRKCLTVAGSDCSGGAGIQADLKTFLANGVYGMSIITALTAQNTTGVFAIQEATPDFLVAQFRAVFSDIRPDAVKVGMVSSPALIEVIADELQHYAAPHIVIDPVMVASTGARLLTPAAQQVLAARLLPLAELVTPNVPELEALTGQKVDSRATMERAARMLAEQLQVNVLAKGGHFGVDADDLLVTAEGIHWSFGQRIANPDTHGTGCTLSSAIAANLAYGGMPLSIAVDTAKAFVAGALKANFHLGHGSGPLPHGFALHGPYFDRKGY